ncbi:hypothetical protein [Limnochorda pilosa]|uniref:Uncharacterized protein n=1 Tax=Limnochorda pilosa TaxID=1555112 RepID=A0A0K2SL73_LIMPI|nr:hypothetical protein [Limnochorda pilosa]BAS27871.1 hypothetical protein LIP_2030 [Limnochorda pilosa]
MKWLDLDNAVLVSLNQVTSIEVRPSAEDEDEGELLIALNEMASGIDLAIARFPSFEAAQAEFAGIKDWLAAEDVLHTVSAPSWVMRSVHEHDDDFDDYDDEDDEDDYDDDDEDDEFDEDDLDDEDEDKD